MAYIGWYITKRNWISVLIFAPVIAFLGSIVFESGRACLADFPHLLITLVFCISQIALYVFGFFPDIKQRLVGVLILAIVIIVLTVISPQVDLQAKEYLPDGTSFSEEAKVEVAESSVCNVQFVLPEEGKVYIYAHKYGITEVTIRDGDKEYRYSFEVYRDGTTARIRITRVD